MKPTAEPAKAPRILSPSEVTRIGTDAQAIEAAHRLAADFAQGASRRDRERVLPWDELDRWSASGLGGITVPRAYGGPQVSHATLAEVFVILNTADSSLGQIPQNQFGVLGVLAEIGTPAQKQRLYGEILAGRRLGNAGPERKADGAATVLQGITRIRATPEGLRVTGRRFYSTGALFAHRVPVRAQDDEGRFVQVWVPRDAPGLTVVDDWDAFGQRTTASGTVLLDEVPVDEQDVLPAWQLADRPSLVGPTSQLIQAAIDQGIAEAAVADTLRFVRERARPWVDSGLAHAHDDPYIIGDIGRLQIDLLAAREVLRETGLLFDAIAAGQSPITAEDSARASVAVAEAKVLTTRIALEAGEKLFELAGSSSTRAEHNLDRHWRNARVHTLHDPVRWKVHLLSLIHI